VDSGMSNLFGDADDEDSGAKRQREKEYGGEGDFDEIVFEEDFADDDEKMDVAEADDEETKDLEERLKKEYKTANKQREGHIDESDDEETPGMTKQAKAMQKLIRNREGNDAYDSDDEKNPYASSEEEEEEEVPIEPVVLQPPVPPQPPVDSQPALATQGPQGPPTPMSRPQGGSTVGSTVGSRAASPSPLPNLGGHSVVAKRATSPKSSKQRANGAIRGDSPLASRATSPVANSRATSPVAMSNVNGAQKKRKATEDYGASPSPTSPNGNAPRPKKRKANSGAIPAGELEDRMVIEWLKNAANATTRDCIQYFQPYLTDEAKKAKFTALIKEVAQLRSGVLVLRSGRG